MAPVSDAVEGRHPVAITCDRLPVDDARLGSKPRQRFDNQRETICQVAARSAVEPHLGTVLAGDNSAIVLDLVQPHRPERRLLGFGRQAGGTKPAGRTRMSGY
jgi:hypothetical protein